MQYSGTAVWKSLGYYETDISRSLRGQIQHDDTWKDKVAEASMTLAELMDYFRINVPEFPELKSLAVLRDVLH